MRHRAAAPVVSSLLFFFIFPLNNNPFFLSRTLRDVPRLTTYLLSLFPARGSTPNGSRAPNSPLFPCPFPLLEPLGALRGPLYTENVGLSHFSGTRRRSPNSSCSGSGSSKGRMWLFPLAAARRSRHIEVHKAHSLPSSSSGSSFLGTASSGSSYRGLLPHGGPPGLTARQDPAVAEAAAEIYAFLSTLPVDVNSNTLGPGLVMTRTEGRLLVGTLLHALDERLLLSLGIHVVVTAAWPFGSWPHKQKDLYRRLGIRHYVHPLLDDPSQVRLY